MTKILSFLTLAILSFTLVHAQKKIVILGSSTAAGGGAGSNDSAWANRLRAYYNKNTLDGVDTTLTNLAASGYVTYKIMPDNFPTPFNRTTWPVDVERNVTKALSLQPNIVIISMPSNDADISPNYDMKETMDNFRALYQQINAAGVRCYITTTQPRNNFTDAQRLLLRQLRDSILNNFGAFSINFWDDLVTNDGLNRLRTEVNADNIHPNNTGHRFLYERVMARNIFAVANAPLPVKLTVFKVQLQNRKALISWHAEEQEQGTVYEVQRSSNGQQYKTLFTQPTTATQAANYTHTDNEQLRGTYYYRLKITEPTQTFYSKIVRLNFDNGKTIATLFTNSLGLHVELGTTINGTAGISIINAAGVSVYNQSQKLTSNTKLDLPVSALPAGQYFLRIVLPDGHSEVQSFIKSK